MFLLFLLYPSYARSNLGKMCCNICWNDHSYLSDPVRWEVSENLMLKTHCMEAIVCRCVVQCWGDGMVGKNQHFSLSQNRSCRSVFCVQVFHIVAYFLVFSYMPLVVKYFLSNQFSVYFYFLPSSCLTYIDALLSFVHNFIHNSY